MDHDGKLSKIFVLLYIKVDVPGIPGLHVACHIQLLLMVSMLAERWLLHVGTPSISRPCHISLLGNFKFMHKSFPCTFNAAKFSEQLWLVFCW